MAIAQLPNATGRQGDPLLCRFTFYKDTDKTALWDLTTLGTVWLAELRPSASTTVPAQTFSMDSSNAATGVLVLSLTAAQTVGMVGNTKYGFDVKAIDTDTTICTSTYTPSPRFTHDAGTASPSAATPVSDYNVILMGDSTGSLVDYEVFTGDAGPPGPLPSSEDIVSILSGVYVPQPAGGTTSGFVPTVQSDGSIAYAAQAGGGGVSFGTDSNGFDTVTISSGSSASFGTDTNGFDTMTI